MKIENEQTHYRARFEMCPYSTTNPAIIEAYRSIYSWIYGKEERRKDSRLFEQLRGKEAQIRFLGGSFSYPEGYEGGLNLEQEPALAIDAIMGEHSGIPAAWALEYDEPDGAIPFRHWHTRIGLSTTGDDTCVVNLSVAYYTLPEYVGRKIRDPRPNIPRLMRNIVELSDYQCNVGETTIRGNAIQLNAATFGPEFSDNLLSPSREIPLILAVSDWEGHYSVGDVDRFASDLLGMANVYALDYRDLQARDMLFRLFEKGAPSFRYNCTAGTVRLYRPGIDLNNAEDSKRHRFFTWHDVSEFRDVGEFAEMLNRSLGRSYIKGDTDVVDIGDIGMLRGRREIEESRRRIDTLSSKLASASKRLLDQPTIPDDLPEKQHIEELNERLADMRESLEEYELLKCEYESSNANLAKLLAGAKREKEELEQALGEANAYKFLVDDANERARKWEAEAGSLRHAFDMSDNLPGFFRNVRDELELAEKLWGNRIVVLDEAYRSAKDYKSFDLEEEWKIISAAANELWDVCFDSSLEGMIDDAFYSRTGVELSMTEGVATRSNPQFMKLRDRFYLGKTVRCEPHLKGRGKGVPNDYFRLHFYIDRDNRKIVIGHCGSHLKSAATNKQ